MQKKNMAIMIHKMHGGGAERVAANLSTHLSDKKYKKVVVTNKTCETGYSFQGEVIDLESKVSTNPFGKLIKFIKRVYHTRRIKKQRRIDVSISLLNGPNLVNIFSKQNDKVIISVRSYISKSKHGPYNRAHMFLIKLLYNKADLIIAVSKEIKRDLIENFGVEKGKIKVIYNYYDVKMIGNKSKEHISEYEMKDLYNTPTIITSGRLSEQKGHWHLIRALKVAKEKIPSLNLVLLGEGELKQYLTELAIELGMGDDIHFLGFKDNPFKYISKADLYVSPSLYEGFPNALCEAMACGLPVISSDCRSGPREILSPISNHAPKKTIEYTDYGVLIPTCDGTMYKAHHNVTTEEHILAASIVEMLLDHEKIEKYKKLSKQRVREFNKNKIIAEWDMLL